jgi:hypothetical protein
MNRREELYRLCDALKKVDSKPVVKKAVRVRRQGINKGSVAAAASGYSVIDRA